MPNASSARMQVTQMIARRILAEQMTKGKLHDFLNVLLQSAEYVTKDFHLCCLKLDGL